MSTCVPEPCETPPGLTLPSYVYGHYGQSASITGGYVYRGTAIPDLVGSYVFADWASGTFYAIDLSEAPADDAATPIWESGGRPTALAEGHDGELYAVFLSGTIQKLVPGPTEGVSAPQLLSETGCVEPEAPQVPALGVVSYSVNASLWSDGANKERYLALPDGATIRVSADGDWHFPVGSVLMKHFYLGTELVETRLLKHHTDGSWAGYSYEWSADGGDASLLNHRKRVQFSDSSWLFPSGSDCFVCHTAAAGYTLGLETAQLNKAHPYGDVRAHQVTTLTASGFLEPLAELDQTHQLAAYEDLSATLEERARAYLHSNCSGCHRPGASAVGDMDLRINVDLEDMGICDVPPGNDLGVMDARLLAPGEPEKSVIPLRMKSLDNKRMPPISTFVVDDVAVEIIDAWIRALADCSS